MHTTSPIDSMHGSGKKLEEFLSVTFLADGTFTVSFEDPIAALLAVDKAKAATWSDYLRAGGNARNKRSHGSQWAAVTKAIRAAS